MGYGWRYAQHENVLAIDVYRLTYKYTYRPKHTHTHICKRDLSVLFDGLTNPHSKKKKIKTYLLYLLFEVSRK